MAGIEFIEIKIRYIRHDGETVEKVEKINVGDWIDLRAAVDVDLCKGNFAYIPLGVAMQLPRGYEAWVAPRSSVCARYGVLQANSIGIIDESYCGDGDEWHFPAYATRDVTIKRGERICQFRIIPHQPAILFHEVESLGNDDRGGLGSTGVK